MWNDNIFIVDGAKVNAFQVKPWLKTLKAVSMHEDKPTEVN